MLSRLRKHARTFSNTTPRDGIVKWYGTQLKQHPWRTKMATSGTIAFLGDLIAQISERTEAELDPKRLAIFTALGFGLVAPTLHVW